MIDPDKECRNAFEHCTETYYEGDFTRYGPNDDYVSAQQQDDFMMFKSGWEAHKLNNI